MQIEVVGIVEWRQEVEVERADRGGVITDVHDGDQRRGRSESRRQLAQPATGGAASWTA